MARYNITYATRTPFPAVAIPGTDPGITVRRGESAEVSEEGAKALKKALDSGALPGLTKDHFKIEAAKEAKPKAQEPPAGDLPEDFPGKADLERQGYATLEKVQAASDEDLIKLDKIGDATLAKIRAYGKPAE